MDLKTTFIYTLSDPRNGTVRYVGKANDLRKRLKEHVTVFHRTRKCRWVKSLINAGVKPVIEELETVPEYEWQEAEQFWITTLRFYGCALVNGNDGGQGGHNPSISTLAKLRATHLGKPLSENHRSKLSAAKQGTTLTESHISAIRESTKKRNTESYRLKMSAAKMRSKHTDETKLLMSLAKKGKPWSEKRMAACLMRPRVGVQSVQQQLERNR